MTQMIENAGIKRMRRSMVALFTLLWLAAWPDAASAQARATSNDCQSDKNKLADCTSDDFKSDDNLKQYAGTYMYGPGVTIEIVAGDGLFAVLQGAKYKLSASGTDEFKNALGQRIPFRRDTSGRITGFDEGGTFRTRLSATITQEAAALAYPRGPADHNLQAYAYKTPPNLQDGIEVGDIAKSELGLPTVKAIVGGVLDGTYKDVHSVLLYLHGRLVMEEYFYGYTASRPHQLRSATKSVVSALAGIAVDRGLLTGTDQLALPALSYATYDHLDPRKAKITLGNLLSMSSGLDCNDHSSDSPGRETVIDEAPDWVKATMDLPVIHDPGTAAFYCSGGVAVVGRMTENATHEKLPDFAQEQLLGPLGIARRDWQWNYDLTNADKEYSQIYLRPRDMLKLGILYAHGGQWGGQQVISAAWVKASLAEQSRVDNTGYGYFWWRPWLNVETAAGPQRVDFMAAQGNGGQKIYLLPQYDLVAVFTAGDYNSVEGAPPNRIMAKIILPALIEAAARQAAH